MLEDDILQVGHKVVQAAIGDPKTLDPGDEVLRLSMVALYLSSQFVIDPLLEQWVHKVLLESGVQSELLTDAAGELRVAGLVESLEELLNSAVVLLEKSNRVRHTTPLDYNVRNYRAALTRTVGCSKRSVRCLAKRAFGASKVRRQLQQQQRQGMVEAGERSLIVGRSRRMVAEKAPVGLQAQLADARDRMVRADDGALVRCRTATRQRRLQVHLPRLSENDIRRHRARPILRMA